MMYRRPAGLAVLAAAAAIGLAACGGGSSTPQVASLGNSSSDATGTPASSGNGSGTSTGSGNPTRLLDEWATCMHGHGDPSQADPIIDANKDIEIAMTDVSAALAGEVHASTGRCGNYLVAAQNALRGGQPAPQAPSLATQLKYAECMRANGVPKFPDPNGTASTDLRDVDTNSPTFQNADKVCSRKTGEPYAPGTEAPGVVIVRSCTPPPGKQCPAGGPGAGGNGGPGADG